MSAVNLQPTQDPHSKTYSSYSHPRPYNYDTAKSSPNPAVKERYLKHWHYAYQVSTKSDIVALYSLLCASLLYPYFPSYVSSPHFASVLYTSVKL